MPNPRRIERLVRGSGIRAKYAEYEGLSSYTTYHRAIFCSVCGQVWLRILACHEGLKLSLPWVVDTRPCRQHGAATIIRWWNAGIPEEIPHYVLEHDFLELSKGEKYA